jgi:hypothetical protein
MHQYIELNPEMAFYVEIQPGINHRSFAFHAAYSPMGFPVTG